MHNTEDKLWWVKHGEKLERHFLERIAPRMEYDIIRNPAKDTNKYAVDYLLNGVEVDLKCQSTPFFRAEELYGIDPTFAVTFNQNDFDRYTKDHPRMGVMFYVCWEELHKLIGKRLYKVAELEGVWVAGIQYLQRLVQRSPLHSYHRRVYDGRGNSKGSYCLDLRQIKCIWREK